MKINIWKIKIRDYCYYIGEYSGVEHSICNLEYSVPKNIPMVFHNGWNYDYNFIIRKLAEELKKQFTFLGKNIEKYITFAIPIEKEATRIDKNGEKITKNKFYILQFIDSVDLWQALYQVLWIIFLKEFIKLNVSLVKTMIRIVKFVEVNIIIVTVFLTIET